MKLKELLILQVKRLEAEPRDKHDIELARYLRQQLWDKWNYNPYVIEPSRADKQGLPADMLAIDNLVWLGKKITEASRIVAKQSKSGLTFKSLANIYHEYNQKQKKRREQARSLLNPEERQKYDQLMSSLYPEDYQTRAES